MYECKKYIRGFEVKLIQERERKGTVKEGRGKIEKRNEKITNETVKKMENTVNMLKSEQEKKKKDKDVAIEEVKENINANEML